MMDILYSLFPWLPDFLPWAPIVGFAGAFVLFKPVRRVAFWILGVWLIVQWLIDVFNPLGGED